MELRDMTLEQIHQFVIDNAPLSQLEQCEVHEVLGNHLQYIGEIWDLADNVNPQRMQGYYGGCGNHRSMTYKLRKLAGYSYP